MTKPVLELAPLGVFVFGALTFFTLTAFYWGERRQGRQSGKAGIFPVFALVCPAAFLSSLVLQIAGLQRSVLPVAAILMGNLTSLLLPLLILHLVLEIEPFGNGSRVRRGVAGVCYGLAGAALLRGLDQTGLVATYWSDDLYSLPAAVLAAACALGLVLLWFSRRLEGDRAYRRWTAGPLLLMLICAVANLTGVAAVVAQMPDHLLLAFFCISPYYRERLVFFDILVKRGRSIASGCTVRIRRSKPSGASRAISKQARRKKSFGSTRPAAWQLSSSRLRRSGSSALICRCQKSRMMWVWLRNWSKTARGSDGLCFRLVPTACPF